MQLGFSFTNLLLLNTNEKLSVSWQHGPVCVGPWPTALGNLWHNKLQQRLGEGCRKPVLGAWGRWSPRRLHHKNSSTKTFLILLPRFCILPFLKEVSNRRTTMHGATLLLAFPWTFRVVASVHLCMADHISIYVHGRSHQYVSTAWATKDAILFVTHVCLTDIQLPA